MKGISLLLLSYILSQSCFAQPAVSDTNYNTRLISVDWMPDGKGVLFTIIKFHKTDRKAPFYSRSFHYDLVTKKAEQLIENAGNLAPAPDGKQIAYMHRNGPNRSDIYIHDVATKQNRLLPTDTMKKNSLSWSPDGKKLLYNASFGESGQHSTIEIFVFDLQTGKSKQITQSGKYKSYSPVWNPESKLIVYYLEKDDRRDQIWLTDVDGSFHSNLTNDTTTLNYFPSWLDEKTILYTQDPETIMTINADGSERKKLEGFKSSQAKYNANSGQFVYANAEPENRLLVYDLKAKKEIIIMDQKAITELW